MEEAVTRGDPLVRATLVVKPDQGSGVEVAVVGAATWLNKAGIAMIES